MPKYVNIQSDFLKFTGNDRLDLINRMSTNEVNSLAKFKGIKTILTSDKGRFVDLITLYNFGDFIFTACSYNNSKKVISHLDKYTIMDDFRAEDMAGTHRTILFYGDDAYSYAKELFNIDVTEFTNNDFGIYSEENKDAVISRNDDLFGGFIFICASEDWEYYSNKLFDTNSKSKFGLKEISAGEYEAQRIEYGMPAFGKEMTEETNPLECGLEKYVNGTKGCYIGQEVIARLDTYDKISKHLVGLISGSKLTDDLKHGEIKITFDDKECGYVTSASHSEKHGNIGLGFIKTAFLDYSKEYSIKSNGGMKCRITKLPFSN
jgi:tRNA-modifying protein YgfZ